MTRTWLPAYVFLGLMTVGPAWARRGTSTSTFHQAAPRRAIPCEARASRPSAREWGSLYSAERRGIDAATAIQMKEYAYRSMQRDIQAREKELGRKLYRDIRNFDRRQERLRNNPGYGDLMRGDTLNLVLQDLWDPKIPPSTLRFASVTLSVSSVQTLPFQAAQLGGVISRRTLTVDNGNGWPVVMKSPAVEAAAESLPCGRRQCPGAQPRAKADPRGPPPRPERRRRPEGRRRSDHPPDRPPLHPGTELSPGAERQARLIEKQIVLDFLSDMDRYPGTTVADLVEFMATV